MSQDLSNEIMFLDRNERSRLAGLLSGQEPVKAINRGRWWQLCDGSTDYISHREIENLHDATFPSGYALDIIRGNLRVKLSKVQDSAGQWLACIAETQKGNLDLIGYEPRRSLELKKDEAEVTSKKDKTDIILGVFLIVVVLWIFWRKFYFRMKSAVPPALACPPQVGAGAF